MKTYTEEELRQAIKFACEYQKATCYQVVGRMLIGNTPSEEINTKVLDYLSNTKTAHKEITIKDCLG